MEHEGAPVPDAASANARNQSPALMESDMLAQPSAASIPLNSTEPSLHGSYEDSHYDDHRPNKKARHDSSENAPDNDSSLDPKKIGFMDLPLEIRQQIYLDALKITGNIDFFDGTGFPHSSGFLRVNKAVCREARIVLYGENRFLFDINYSKVGEYWEEDWKEAGYRFVRKFLIDIGPINTSLIKNLGICFRDSSRSGEPRLDVEQRRFERNSDLLWILEHLRRHGRIQKLKLQFSGNRVFKSRDSEEVFLDALATIKTDHLAFGHAHTEGVESAANLNSLRHRLPIKKEDKLKESMVRPRAL
ncbi:hypothetical protein ACLMJK_008117 [Lecanora helva]